MKIKLRKADIEFSKYLREKVGQCERCFKKDNLQVSHFFGRRHENTRFSEENCDVLCFACHNSFHERPNDYVEWKKRKLGEKRFKDLEIAANLYCKRDDKLTMLYIKKLQNDRNKKKNI